MIRLLLPLVLAAVVAVSAGATEGIEVRFLAQAAPENLGRVVLVADETRSEPFDLPVNNLSGAMNVPAREFTLWSERHQRVLANIRVPEAMDSCIVLLLVTSGGAYRPVVLPREDPSFRGGDIRFLNNSDKPVFGYVGSARFTLQPGRSTVVRPTGAHEGGFYDIGLGVREPDGDRVLRTMRWPEDALARFYVFFYTDPATGRVTYRAVDEFVGEAESGP